MKNGTPPPSARRDAPYPGSGRCRPENQAVLGPARFSLLGTGLVRVEWQDQGRFEDRASYFAVRRDQAPVPHRREDLPGGGLRLETDRFSLEYRPDGRPFHAGNLELRVKPSEGFGGGRWRPGDANLGNLGGTLRTLDEAEGPLDLDLGVLSRDGWSLHDDSAAILFSEEEPAWAEPRPADSGSDWYLFAFGADYAAGLADFSSVGGRIPLPPRFALGAWYSRYWPYTSEEFLAIADEFRRRGFPLDVMVLDMDWHREGWTGWSWNRGLIPDPEALLRALHERGLRTTMNLHPHDGVAKHEDAYAEFARAMGKDPAKGERVPFDPTDRRFMDAYFKVLLHPLEAQGVDFWWMDWQQGTESRIPGLDPLMWLNHRHFWDRQRPPAPGAAAPLRGMNFSRWGGWGDHRYPVHFSGDTHANWEVLGYLARFTATAGNVGVSWWSHDLGGHFGSGDRVEPELYLRWLQFGALSPVMRIHSSRDPNNDRLPWLFGETFTAAARAAFTLRASLVPYLYTAAREAHDSGLPLLRPLYLHYGQRDEAFHCPGQYLLGADLLCVTVADPGHGPRKVAQVPVWFPPGDWYHWETHQRFTGPLWTTVAVPFEGVALFARGGAAIPLNAPGHAQACGSDGPLVLRVYPGPAAERSLYEDDGETQAFEAGAYTRVALSTRPEGDGLRLQAGPRVDGQGSTVGGAVDFMVEAPRSAAPAGGGLGPLRCPLPAPWPGGDAALDLAPLVDPAALDAYDRSLACQRRASLALDQLDAAHALREPLHGLAAAAEHLLHRFHGRDGAAALDAEAAALEAREAGLIASLAAAGASAEAALRCLAGVALLAWIDRGPDGLPLLRAELRREARAIKASQGDLALDWELEGKAGAASLHINGSIQRAWQQALELDGRALRVWRGRLNARLRAFGCELTLTEPIDWDGRAVKDWSVKGPLPKDAEADPAAAPAGDGWTPRRFEPTRVARGLRHFHDLGGAFHCPDGACLAAAEVLADRAGRVRFIFHHDGKARLWLNGAELKPEGPRFEAELKAGANRILVRLQNVRHESRGLHLSVEAADGGEQSLQSRPPAGASHA